MAVHLQLRPPDKRDEIGAGADLLAGAPLPVLCITEEWIRERLNLKINSLGTTVIMLHYRCMMNASFITTVLLFELVTRYRCTHRV